jgi:hypothetical protein
VAVNRELYKPFTIQKAKSSRPACLRRRDGMERDLGI